MGECISNMLKTNVIIVEYPSYGVYKNSKPSEKKICNDSLFIYDFLIEQMNFKPMDICIMGRSLGSVPSIFLAKH